jgi:hypothetical protein
LQNESASLIVNVKKMTQQKFSDRIKEGAGSLSRFHASYVPGKLDLEELSKAFK